MVLWPSLRFKTALALALATSAAVMSSTLITVALPGMARDLGVTASTSIWIVTAYQIGVVAALIPMSAAGEAFGIRRIYLSGLLLLMTSAGAATLATDFLILCLLRLAQGVGAAAIMALNGALLRSLFPRDDLGRGISYNAILIAVVGAGSPSLAGLILAFWDWPALFLVMAFTALAAVAASARSLPSERSLNTQLGLFDIALNALVFGLFILGLSSIGRDVPIVALSTLAMTCITAAIWLWRRSARSANPLWPLDLLAARKLRLSYLTSFLCFCAQGMAIVTLPFFIGAALGFGPGRTGTLLSLWPAFITLAAFTAGRLVERVSPMMISTIGLCLFAAGLIAVPLVNTQWVPTRLMQTALMAAALVACGGGFGLFQTPNNRTMLLAAPGHRIAAAAGMIAQVRLVGQGTGAATAGAMFALGGVLSPAPYLIGAVLALIAATLNLRRLWERYGPRAIARREDAS